MDGKYSTTNIMEDLKNGKDIPISEINCTGDLEREKYKISHDIDEQFKSRSAFCKEACISDAHLSMFFSNKKNMDRDHLLRMFITLGYELDPILTLLKRFGVEDLYPRNPRDFIIIKGILAKKDLDAIDVMLEEKGLPGICFETNKSKKR